MDTAIRRRLTIGSVSVAGFGVLLLVASGVLNALGGAGWWSDLTMGIGYTVLLFAPLLILTEWLLGRVHRLEGRVKQNELEVGQAQREVADVASRESSEPTEAKATFTSVDVDSPRSEELLSAIEDETVSGSDALDDQVRSALLSDFRAKQRRLESVRTADDPETFAEVLELAMNDGLVSRSGPRVLLRHSSLRLRISPSESGGVDLVIERDSGHSLGEVHWRPGEGIAEALQRVGEVAKSHYGFVGIDNFFPARIRDDLADLLLYAQSQSNEANGRGDISSVVEITDQGWIITDDGLRPKSVPFYLISFEQRSPIDWDEHILNKNWPESAAFPDTFRWALKLHEHSRNTARTAQAGPLA